MRINNGHGQVVESCLSYVTRQLYFVNDIKTAVVPVLETRESV